MQLLNRLKLWQKLALLVAAMAVPTALLGVFYLSSADSQVAQARNELTGAEYAHQVGVVLADVANHRSLLFAVLTGDTARRYELTTSELSIDKEMVDTDKNDAAVGSRLGLSDDWQAIKSDWQQLKATELKLSADDAVAQHDALVARIVKLGNQVVARSGLNVDPSPQTAALIQIATRDVPNALIASGNVQWYATRASIKGYLGGDDQMALRLYHDEVVSNFASSMRDLNGAPAIARAKIAPALATARGASDSTYGIISARIISAQKMTITTAELFSDSRAISSSLQSLSDIGYSAMNGAVKRRLAQVTTWRNLTAGITVIALGVALALSWLITRSLATPLARAIEVFGSIAAGRYDSTIDLSGSDEAGQVLRALDDMQGKLRSQIENERLVAAENARVRQALDKVSTSVVLADARHRIIYLNETANATFARNQHEIRLSLPGFEVQRLRGSPLEALSADAAGERHELDTLADSRAVERQLGACTFRTVTNPVLDEGGTRIGTVMEWSDRTQEVAVENEMQGMLSDVVAGDLGSRIDVTGKSGFFEAMSRGVNQLADNMAEVVSRVKRVAADVHRGADEISAGNANLSQRTEEQSSSLEETASSMEEMTTTVKQNADNAAQANQLALAARDQAEKGGTVVSHAVAAMAGINEASKKIADIIGVIDDIAFQTNLLALNAAVEAARAGEQGRGFAVVASEVRSLAGRSATAAKEIKGLIQDSVRKVEGGSVLVTQSGHTLEKIVAAVKKVSDIVAEIAAASREQSSGIEQVNRAVMQMDELTQQNASLVEEATAASQAMAEQVRGLNEMLGRFQVDMADIATTATQPAPSAKPATAAAARMERRGVSRPWVGRAKSRSAPKAQAARTVAPPQSASLGNGTLGTGDAGDAEWQEF
ncbi:MAG TPA: methyl-accepting chemotaxis protein [Steroidobacteraceae bacterium]|jgi:methyl-accepting chemotaxis protein|nr:methyl-accepting chemotaxis protein [Steroidobacteraceae bacterium]